ncbi:AAA family ATPase [Sandarakinorhabdus sp. DWP1-3-1]|uniref:AAA family ATPase n=1 Tax=Sandarakinorhabdus sp. DWP1-3-1 TaxID=2804627 RepID=UPI003CEEF012
MLEPASPALRVTIVLDPETAALLDESRLALPDTSVRIFAGTLAGFASNGPMLRATDVLIAQFDAENPREFEEFERFVQAHRNHLPVIAAVSGLTVALTRKILRSDAVDVLPVPFTPDELHQAIETGRHQMLQVQPQARMRGGRILTFVGALGGVGTTAVASQAALIWAEKQSVCLIDLDLQFGNAALYLNLKPQLTLADLLDAGDRLDAEFLRSVADRHVSGLSVIASPRDMMPLDALTPEFVERLLDLAAQSYDVVLVDLPGAWISWSLSALQKSDAICLIAGLTVPGVHQARRQIEVLEANDLGDRVRLVLNRIVTPMFGKADLSQAETVLRRKVNFPVANDYPTISTAIDEGKAIGSIKVRSRIEKDMRAMVADLSAMIGAEQAAPR